MNSTRTLVCTIAIICITSVSAMGQVLSGRVSANSLGQTQLSLGSTGQSTFKVNSDVIFANGSAGPYTLAYRPVNRFSESISVDGKLQQRDFDYDVNYATGQVTFKKGISANSVIRAEFSFDPTKATPNSAPLSVPITLDLVKGQNSALKFTGLYKQADPNAKSASDLVVYGLNGDKTIGQGKLTSMLLFTPDLSGADNQSGFSDRSAIKLGGSTKGSNFNLSSSYLHVGEAFASAKDYNLQQGIQAMDLAATYDPSKQLNLQSSFNRTELLAGEKKGEVVSTTQQKVVLTPGGAPKLTLAHVQVDKEKPGTIDIRTTTDTMLLEHKLGTNMTAAASHESVAVDAGSSDSRITTNQLLLSAKPSDTLSIKSRLGQKDSSVDGSELGYGMDIDSNPNKTTSIKASMNRLDTDKTGKSGIESLNLAMNPNKMLDLKMNVAHSSTDSTGDELVHSLSIVSMPTTDWRLELGLKGKNVDRPEDEFARTFMLSTTAVKKTSVQLNWAQNDTDVTGLEQTEGIRVVAAPGQSITLTGGLSQRETETAHDLNKEATIALKPFANTTVSGAYKQTETNGAVVAKVSEMSASAKPAGFLNVSGGFKNRETVGQDDLNSTNVAMQVDTGGLLKLTGSYTTNPEDAKGVVQRVNAQTIGLKTDFGRLKMKGAYTFKEEYLAGKSGQQTDVGLDYRMSLCSLLTTSYSIDERKDISLLQTSIYALGYTHNVGSRINLYLTGKMTTYEKDRAMLEDQTEYEAEARLGLKF